jgi:hypothetical protein
MAEGFGAEQALKNHPHLARHAAQAVFSGWSNSAGMADCREKTG